MGRTVAFGDTGLLCRGKFTLGVGGPWSSGRGESRESRESEASGVMLVWMGPQTAGWQAGQAMADPIQLEATYMVRM